MKVYDKSLDKAEYIKHLREAFEVPRHHMIMLNPTRCAFEVGFGNFSGPRDFKRGVEVKHDKSQDIKPMELLCS